MYTYFFQDYGRISDVWGTFKLFSMKCKGKKIKSLSSYIIVPHRCSSDGIGFFLGFAYSDPCNLLNFIFRKPHFAQFVRGCSCQANIMNWLAMSPDLSPIEHLWDEMKRRLQAQPNQPRNLNQLERDLRIIWNNIPQALIQRLIGSVRRCCRAFVTV